MNPRAGRIGPWLLIDIVREHLHASNSGGGERRQARPRDRARRFVRARR